MKSFAELFILKKDSHIYFVGISCSCEIKTEIGDFSHVIQKCDKSNGWPFLRVIYKIGITLKEDTARKLATKCGNNPLSRFRGECFRKKLKTDDDERRK